MKCIDLLIRRGFLINKENNGYYLNDNSHAEDPIFLNQILKSSKIGYVEKDGLICITGDEEKALTEINKLFLQVKKGTVGVGTCSQNRSWTYHVAKRYHAAKLPVSWLEPNIAAYIKALSAIGIYTSGCCDGNHPKCYTLNVDFDGPIYCEFHKCLWEHLLNHLFNLKWDDTYRFIDLTENRQSQYDELFCASQYIYNHRWAFINLRRDAALWMKRKTLKHMGRDEIKERFLSEAIKNLESGPFISRNGNELRDKINVIKAPIESMKVSKREQGTTKYN